MADGRWGVRGPCTGGSGAKRTGGYTVPPSSVGSGLGAMPPPAVLSMLALGSTGGPETAVGVEPTSAGSRGPPASAGGQPLQPATSPSGPVAVSGSDGETAAGPFVLREGIPPVPAKVVARIWKGEYVDMADLLRDNLEADRRRATAQRGSQQQGQAKATRREVPRPALVGPVFLHICWGGGGETPPPGQAVLGIPGHDPLGSKALWGEWLARL